MSQSKVQHIFRVFDALNLVKGIKAVGGPDHQTYYIESDVYAPDRRITPLILQPYVEVSDPNGVIPAGDKVGELSSASWYIGEAILANKITAKESEATLDTPFAIGENNALHIRKNSTKSILLIFEGEYLDIRKDKNIHISLTYTLTTTSNTEVKPAPKLMLSKPQSWKYCPLENQTKAVIEATVSQDSKLYRSAVEWCKVEDNRDIPLSDEPFVLGGQNSNKLVVNPHVMGDTLLRARNLSEEAYNKYYGINPEWDDRMQEVMDNRNLVALSRMQIGSINGSTGAEENSQTTLSSKDFIQVKGMEFITLSFSNADKFYGAIQEYDLDEKIIHDSGWIKPKTIRLKPNTIYVRYLFRRFDYSLISVESFKKECLAKLEQGVSATHYTPAPEDLNYRNLMTSTDFQYPINTEVWQVRNGSCRLSNQLVDNLNVLQIESLKAGANGIDLGIVTNAFRQIDCVLTFFAKASKDCLMKWRWGFDIAYIDSNITTEWQLITIPLNKSIKSNNWLHPQVVEKGVKIHICDFMIHYYKVDTPYQPAPEDLAPDGIIKGSYQSDIKYTRYFPKLETEIDFLTGDTLRAGMDTVKMKAVFKTNKEEIKNPEQYFDIKWYLDPVEAGGKAEHLGQGETLEVPISKIPLKARAIPFRLEYEFK